MTTIKDVACKAGVSISTVSATLNSTKYVSDELQKRVFAAVEAVGYTPNIAAQSLKTGTTNIIGLILPDITNPFFAVLARAVETAASKLKYMVLLCNSDEDPDKEKDFLRLLKTHQVAGIILAPSGSGREHGIWLSDTVKTPVVMVDRTVEGVTWDSVVSLNKDGARRAVTHLIERGHSLIGGVFGRTYVSTIKDRLAGYKEAIKAAGYIVDPGFIRMNSGDQEQARQAAQSLLNLPVRPTALFASNSHILQGVMHAIHNHGLRCPEDISVTGFDGMDWADLMHPPMTTVEQSAAKMGEKAVNLLLCRLDKVHDKPHRITLSTQFLVRGSSAPLPDPSAANL